MATHLNESAKCGKKTLALEGWFFEYFSLEPNEDTDVSDSTRLAIFVGGVDKYFSVTEDINAAKFITHHKSL
jgi:hypothetical protein